MERKEAEEEVGRGISERRGDTGLASRKEVEGREENGWGGVKGFPHTTNLSFPSRSLWIYFFNTSKLNIFRELLRYLFEIFSMK